jgi:ribokinase
MSLAPTHPAAAAAFVGHVTLDDVVLSDGRAAMGQIGGAAIYSAVGGHLAGISVTLTAKVGPGFPGRLARELRAAGIRWKGASGPPAHLSQWVLYERDGSRQYVAHPGSSGHLEAAPRPGGVDPSDLPGLVHLAPMPPSIQAEWVDVLVGSSRSVTMDTAEVFIEAGEARILGLVPMLTAFLPSQVEAALLYGSDDMERAAASLRALGAGIVVIKLGAEGSLLATADEIVHVPAHKVVPVDSTGAGDAYCGGFVAGLAAGVGPLEAAKLGTAAAAVTVQQFGALTPLAGGQEAVSCLYGGPLPSPNGLRHSAAASAQLAAPRQTAGTEAK